MHDEGIRFAVGLKLKKGKFYARIRTYVPGAPRKETDRLIGPAWDSKRGRVPRGHFTKAMAEDRVAEVERELYAVEDAPKEAIGTTLAALNAAFLDDREKVKRVAPSTLLDYIRLGGILETRFKDKLADGITVDDVESYRDEILETRTPRTANKHVAHLSAMYGWGLRKRLVTTNPADPVDVIPDNHKTEVIVFTPEQIRHLAGHALDETNAALYITAAMTGLRQGELRELRWKDVAFRENKIVVARAISDATVKAPKSGKGRYVPLAPEVFQTLFKLKQRGWSAGEEDLVFCHPDGTRFGMTNTYRRYQSALRRAGLPQVKFHGLRHTFGSTMARSDVKGGLATIQQYMGHANIATTELYRQWMPMADEAAEVANAFGAPTQGYSGGTGLEVIEGGKAV